MTATLEAVSLRRLDAQETFVLLGGQDGRSLKTRMMRWLVDRALSRGLLQSGATVADISPGTGALALAQIAAEKGLRACLYVPSDESLVARLEALGAEARTGPPTADGMRAALQELADRHAARQVYWTRQNYDEDASAAYEPLARQVLEAGRRPTTLIAGLGTGGVLRGFGRVLRAACPDLRIIAVVSANMPGLRPPGMVMDFLEMRDLGAPGRLHQALGPVEIMTVDAEHLQAEHDWLRTCGIQAGPSTAGALHVARLLNLRNSLIVSVDGSVRANTDNVPASPGRWSGSDTLPPPALPSLHEVRNLLEVERIQG